MLPYNGKVLTLVTSAVVAVVYVGLLALLRELGQSDLAMVANVVGRRR
jgi:hypothetical protein